jgi:hypothetical protein
MGKALENAIKLANAPIDVAEFGVSPSRTALFNRTTIQELIDDAYDRDGGVLRFTKPIPIDTGLTIPQRVFLVADFSQFVNQFVSGEMEPLGGGLVLQPGANTNAVTFRCSLYNDGGVLRELTHDRRNSEARHGGGLVNLMVWGGRSENQDPSVADLNATGDAISVEGSRYVKLFDVFAMMAAGDGVGMISYDYGTGAISSNNAKFRTVNCLSNHGHGGNLAGGDNKFIDFNCGYNFRAGVQTIGSGEIIGGSAWNNVEDGLSALGTPASGVMSVVGFHSYDNGRSGYRQSTGRSVHLAGCVARGNGRDSGYAAIDRANYFVSSGAEDWSIKSCESSAKDFTGANVTQYDYYINNTTYAGEFSGNSDSPSSGPSASGSFFADKTKVRHNASVQGLSQPGVTYTGTVDMGSNVLTNLAQLRFGAWGGVAIAAGAIVPGNNSLITLNEAAPTNLTDITYSSTGIPEVTIRNIGANAITVVHNTAKLRLNSGANITLNQHQSITFHWVSGAVWQHTGGKAS